MTGIGRGGPYLPCLSLHEKGIVTLTDFFLRSLKRKKKLILVQVFLLSGACFNSLMETRGELSVYYDSFFLSQNKANKMQDM